MDVEILPRHLRGTVTPPPSKSIAHRIVLAEALAGADRSSVSPSLSEDIRATVRCVEALRSGDGAPLLDCGESGSTLRFLIPVALYLRGGGTFTGRGRLMERPLGPYQTLFREKGILFDRTGEALTVRGTLGPGEYRLPGDVSSQFITGLLFVLPLLEGDSVLRLTSPLGSAPYVDLTLDVLGRSGIVVRRPAPDTFLIPGGQRYRTVGIPLEADWSQAAFWYAAAFLGNSVEVSGMDPSSAQGDRRIVELSRLLSDPAPADIDLSGIPDLFPPLAVMAARRTAVTRFSHAGRLRIKESDRLDRIADLLRAFRVEAETGPDWMEVRGGIPALEVPVTVDGANDHRIVMAAAVLASVWRAPVTILGAEAVEKSYPSFFADYRQLGGEIHVL